MTIEERANGKMEKTFNQEIHGMTWEQREKYLSSIAIMIDEMRKEEPHQICLDNPIVDEQYFEQHPYDEGFFRT